MSHTKNNSGIKFENVMVFGFESAMRGMRNPFESWNQSDSLFYDKYAPVDIEWNSNRRISEFPILGENDLKLAQKLIKQGSSHRKFLRQIMVWVDLTLPLYVWTELDTYKVATVRNSCSTMNKLGRRDIIKEDFAFGEVDENILNIFNKLSKEYMESENKDFEIIRRLKRMLPSGYLLKSTFMASYETWLTMYSERVNHRLPEWNSKDNQTYSITRFIYSLPYMSKFLES